MKLNIHGGDLIIVKGATRKLVQISELNVEEKLKLRIPPQTIARRLTLNDKTELIFLS